MPENIVSSMFGLDPEQLNRQRVAQSESAALRFAQLEPEQRSAAALYGAGSNLARAGMGMLGFQDREQAMAQQAQEVQKRIDHSTPEGLMQGAQLFNQAGNARMAMMYQQAAQAAQEKKAALARTQAQEQLYQAQAERAAREQQFQERRPMLTEEGIEGKEGWVRKTLVDADGNVIWQGKPYKQTAAISAESRVSAAEKKSDAKLTAQLPQAKLRTSLMLQNLHRLDADLGDLYEDKGLENITGPVYGRVPNITPSATGAQAKLNSIKSQIFVGALQAMREASKTGGAVGNVSNREGDKLESTLGALEQPQSTADFKKQVKKIRDQISTSMELINQAYEEQFGDVEGFKKVSIPAPKQQPNTGWAIRKKVQ